MGTVEVRLVQVTGDIGRRVEVGPRRRNIAVPYLDHTEIIVSQSVSIVGRDGQS